MRTYNEAFHAKRLVKMLEQENICGRYLCPAGKRFSGNRGNMLSSAAALGPRSKFVSGGVCLVCQEFIDSFGNCPCHKLGAEEAISRTKEALKAKGYM